MSDYYEKAVCRDGAIWGDFLEVAPKLRSSLIPGGIKKDKDFSN